MGLEIGANKSKEDEVEEKPVNFLGFIYVFYLCLAILGLHCYRHVFSSCGKCSRISSFHTRASHCIDFSCCGAQALEYGLSSSGTQT